MRGKGASDEGLAGDSGEEREAHLLELGKMGKQRIVLFKPFAEAEAGVEHEMIALDAGERGSLGPLSQFALDKQNWIADRGGN